jgi:hypothetical protein
LTAIVRWLNELGSDGGFSTTIELGKIEHPLKIINPHTKTASIWRRTPVE